MPAPDLPPPSARPVPRPSRGDGWNILADIEVFIFAVEAELEAWARSLGPVRAFGVEGTGSYGAGLSRFLSGQGHTVLEVNRPDRQLRRQHGKSDPIDAEAAARAVPPCVPPVSDELSRV